ncbi:MAG: hydroxyacid dehydrogenase [Acidobacteriaceae bacterium]
MRDILIPESIRGAAVDALICRFDVLCLPELWKDSAALAAHIKDFRAMIVRNQTHVSSSLLSLAPNLKVVGRAGVGLDNVDVEYASKVGILVTYTPDQNAISVAEISIGLMLSLARSIPAATHDTKAGRWSRQQFVGIELYGKTLGIVGAGKIGYLTAKRAQAFGMKILAYDPFLSQDNIYLSELNAELVELDELLTRADIVSCHLPATSRTIGLLGADHFKKMKPTAYFINTARGEVVREAELLQALKTKTIAGAALDVRATEPPETGELELLPNVVLTPHIAAFTHEAQERVTKAVCEDVARVLEGKSAQNAVNGHLVLGLCGEASVHLI